MKHFTLIQVQYLSDKIVRVIIIKKQFCVLDCLLIQTVTKSYFCNSYVNKKNKNQTCKLDIPPGIQLLGTGKEEAYKFLKTTNILISINSPPLSRTPATKISSSRFVCASQLAIAKNEKSRRLLMK